MKSIQRRGACLVLAALLIMTGCDSNNKVTDKSNSNSSTAGPGEHTHADGTVHKDHSHDGHTHGPGPHDGTIADWGGGKFHVEITIDHQKQEATVYILAGDEKTPAPIDATEIMLTIHQPALSTALKAVPQPDDPEAKASRFVGAQEAFGVAQMFEGSISGLVDGTPYSGSFKQEVHHVRRADAADF